MLQYLRLPHLPPSRPRSSPLFKASNPLSYSKLRLPFPSKHANDNASITNRHNSSTLPNIYSHPDPGPFPSVCSTPIQTLEEFRITEILDQIYCYKHHLPSTLIHPDSKTIYLLIMPYLHPPRHQYLQLKDIHTNSQYPP